MPLDITIMLLKNKKNFKPIPNGNVADSGIIALTDESLPCSKKSKKEWKFKRKFWIKKLINCCFSQNITKHKLTTYLIFLGIPEKWDQDPKVRPGTQDPRVRHRSSHSQLFFKIGILKHFAIFAGKHLCWGLFLIN